LPIRYSCYHNDLFFFLSFPFFSFLFFNEYKIGGLDLNEQAILVNFYNSLTSKGNLNWNVLNDLCVQSGVSCDSSNPRRITQLYFLFLFLFSFSFSFLEKFKKMIHLILTLKKNEKNEKKIEISILDPFQGWFQLSSEDWLSYNICKCCDSLTFHNFLIWWEKNFISIKNK